MQRCIYLESGVDFGGGSGGLDVEDDVGGVEDGGDVDVGEFFVGDGEDGGIELLSVGELVDYFEAVFSADGFGIGPWVEDRYVEVVFLEGLDDVYDFCVAHVGTVLFEGEAEDYDVAAKDLYPFLEH